jgi:hypothetical protein
MRACVFAARFATHAAVLPPYGDAHSAGSTLPLRARHARQHATLLGRGELGGRGVGRELASELGVRRRPAEHDAGEHEGDRGLHALHTQAPRIDNGGRQADRSTLLNALSAGGEQGVVMQFAASLPSREEVRSKPTHDGTPRGIDVDGNGYTRLSGVRSDVMKRVTWSLVLTAALLFGTATASHAQRHGGHGGGHGGHGGHGGGHGWYGGGHGWHGGGRGGRVIVGIGPWWGGYPYRPFPYWYGPYAAPYYAYPPPSVVVQEPPAYVEQPAPAPAYWYYCPVSKAYYPTVQSCAEAWIRVPQQPQ